MKRIAFVVIPVALAQLSCSGSSQPVAPTNQLTSLSISGATTLTETKPSVQLTLSANAQDVTNAATWQSSDTTIANVSAGLVRAVGLGTVTISATYQQRTASAPLVVGQDGDCDPYDPASVALMQNTSESPPFLSVTAPISGGVQLLAAADNQTDANNLLTLFRSYSQLCLIGRSNNRPNRLQYIVNYFKGASGQQGTIAPEDCVAFSASAVQVVSQGSDGWAVMSGGTELALMDTQLEASLVAAVAAHASNECFIGRANTRPNHYDFVTDYWK